MTTTDTIHANAAPAFWNISRPRPAHFIGREKSISHLAQGFAAPAQKAKVMVITGPVGIGKSSVALEWAYSKRGDYDLIWWIRADSPSSIATDLTALAAALDPSAPEIQDANNASLVVRRALQQRQRWLLIFDDAHLPADVSPHVSWGSGGNVLITSRNPEWEPLAKPIVLKPWQRKESVAFLQKRIPSMHDTAIATKLALALGDHPMALEQAAACIEQTRITPKAYLQEYESYWGELLLRGATETDHPEPQAMAWELSFRQIEKSDPVAVGLMTLCSFFGTSPVPWNLVVASPDSLPNELKDVAFNHARLHASAIVLRQFSVAETTEETITIPAMVGALARSRLSEQDHHQWAIAALESASHAFPYDCQELASWSLCAPILSHVLAVTSLVKEDVAPTSLADLLNRAGLFLLKLGQFAQAQEVLTRAMALVEQVWGRQSPKAADIANNLGRVRQRLGDYTSAMTLFETALEIDGPLYGPGDPHMATVANNLGISLAAAGSYDRAKSQFEWSLQVFQTKYGQDHPRVACVLNNLAFILIRLNEVPIAREHLTRALSMTEEVYGPHHPDVACILSNLGDTYRLLGQPKEARPLHDRALSIISNTLGSTHPAAARDMAKIGVLMLEEGDHTSAITQLQKALQIKEQVFGLNHPELALDLHALGRAHKSAGHEQQAAACFSRAGTLSRKVRAEPEQDYLTPRDVRVGSILRAAL